MTGVDNKLCHAEMRNTNQLTVKALKRLKFEAKKLGIMHSKIS